MLIFGILEVFVVWIVGGGVIGVGGGCIVICCVGIMSFICWIIVWWILELRCRLGGGLYVVFVYFWGYRFFG